MNVLLTLCDKELIGDIPVYEFKNLKNTGYINDAQELVHHWLETKNFKKSVFVCFENMRGLPIKELRNEQQSILVSHDWDDITGFCELHLDCDADYDVDFAIFEFSDYKEAFEYCIDLKESF